MLLKNTFIKHQSAVKYPQWIRNGNKPDLLSVLDLQMFRQVLRFLVLPDHLQDPLVLSLLCHPESKLTPVELGPIWLNNF